MVLKMITLVDHLHRNTTRIFHGAIPETFTSLCRPRLLKAEVYTLGTGRWRSAGHVPYKFRDFYGPFLNGHAHWTVLDKDSPEKLCAFDFDKETFELFPSPPSESHIYFQSLGIINGCGFDIHKSTDKYKFTIWVMKEYGIKKSWHKELEIQQSISYDFDFPFYEHAYILKGLKDGTILMASYNNKLFAYCPWSETIVDMETFHSYFTGLAYRPSFHRLRNFKNERVHVF